MDEQAIVPIMTYRHRAVASDRLVGFRLNPLGVPDLSSVSLAARTLSSNG
jgi:MarR-like DNA-binding transcriptional regulator SgrR of sgrS sRNA